MVNYSVKLLIKIVLSTVGFLIIATAMKYYQTSIGGSVAVGQLEDSYSSSANMKMWQDFKNNWIIGYGFLVLILFFTDIKKLFSKKY